MPDWDWGTNEEKEQGQRREGEFLTIFVSARKTPSIAKVAFHRLHGREKTVLSKTKVESI